MVIAVWLYRTTRPQPTQDQIVSRQTDTAVRGMQSQTEEATLEAGRRQLEQLRQSQSAVMHSSGSGNGWSRTLSWNLSAQRSPAWMPWRRVRRSYSYTRNMTKWIRT